LKVHKISQVSDVPVPIPPRADQPPGGRRQGRYWILTLSCRSNDWTPCLPEGLCYVRGQQEIGEGGFVHYQVMVAYPKKVGLPRIRADFGTCHAELTKSDAARAYVWKEESRVPDTQFEIGRKATKRNSAKDWDAILESAKSGNFEVIPSDIMLRCFSNINRIAAHFAQPVILINVRLLLNEQLMSFGAELRLEKVVVLGKKLGYQLILKHHPPSGGMDTEVINTLLLTSFAVKLELDTSYVGSTGIRSLWKPKEVRLYSRLHQYGLRVIYRPMIGTPVLMKKLD